MKNPNYTDPMQFSVGVFDDLSSADRAVARLLEAGYTKEQVSVICSDEYKADALKHENAIQKEETPESLSVEAAKQGSIVGGSIGALGGFALCLGLVGSSGIGLLIAGPVLAVSTAGGAVVGTLINEMRMRGIEKQSADFYDRAVQEGKILVAVDVRESGEIHNPVPADHIFEELNAHPVELHSKEMQ